MSRLTPLPNSPLSKLPFFDLDNQEFLRTTESWVHSSYDCILESKDLFHDIVISPGDEENFQGQLSDNSISNSKYYSIKQSGNLFHKAKQNHGFSLIHFNMRSLSKNLTLLEDFLVSLKSLPEVIAISETKLKEQSINNISISGYKFLNTNSITSAGGVGLCIINELQFSRKHDLEISIIERHKQKNIVIGSIYRHPSRDCNRCCQNVKQQLSIPNNKGKEVFLLGDFNINLLNYITDILTSDYLDTLFELGFMPLITKPTRVTDHTSTLTDHILLFLLYIYDLPNCSKELSCKIF